MKVGEKNVREVATGGDPVAALARSQDMINAEVGVYDVGVAHDDGCPSLTEQAGLPGCTCEIIELHVTRLS